MDNNGEYSSCVCADNCLFSFAGPVLHSVCIFSIISSFLSWKTEFPIYTIFFFWVQTRNSVVLIYLILSFSWAVVSYPFRSCTIFSAGGICIFNLRNLPERNIIAMLWKSHLNIYYYSRKPSVHGLKEIVTQDGYLFIRSTFLISVFCERADGFQGVLKAFHCPI